MTQPDQDTHAIRMFLAAPIDEAAREKLAEAQNAMRRIGADLKWVAPPNIHLTLAFLGDIFDSLVPSIIAAMDQVAARHAPSSLDIRGLGWFGSPASPKVVWAGLTGKLQPLMNLQAELADALRTAGLSPDTRKPFHPHLTLGRTRTGRNGRELADAIRSHTDDSFGRLEIKEMLLVQSRLQPQGPVYAALHVSRLPPANGT